jgi:membrane fusion protein (multidrug efflux system)
MLIRVGVSRGQRNSASAPESAVSVQGDNSFVYVLQQRGDRTMAEQRPIVAGLRQQGYVEIVDGVRPGERLVADGLNKIQPGQPVLVARTPGMGAIPGKADPSGGAAPAAYPRGPRPPPRPAV